LAHNLIGKIQPAIVGAEIAAALMNEKTVVFVGSLSFSYG
jgi:hypothetical protein